MPLEINAQFRKFVEFAQQRANPATSKAIARAGDEEPLGGRAIKAAAVAVAAVALASCAQVPGDAGANADAARGLRFGHWPTNSTESIEWRVLEERGGRALLLADRVLDAPMKHQMKQPATTPSSTSSYSSPSSRCRRARRRPRPRWATPPKTIRSPAAPSSQSPATSSATSAARTASLVYSFYTEVSTGRFNRREAPDGQKAHTRLQGTLMGSRIGYKITIA